jgi:hypothetical protein
MLLQQYFTKDKDSIRYYVENLTTQTLFWSVYRKKVVVFGDAPVERATDPVVVLPGETGILPKPAIKLPWKRYIAFSHDAALLTEHPTAKEFEGLLNIWTDELNGVVLTEYTAPDGVQCVKVSSWAAWNAKKRMAPASAKMHSVHDHFLHEMHTKLIHGLPPHKYQTTVARIRTGSQLCAGEQEFNAMRGAVVKEAIGKLTGLDVSAFSETNVPRISICASGGGYRVSETGGKMCALVVLLAC